jgi:hypothetical protein
MTSAAANHGTNCRLDMPLTGDTVALSLHFIAEQSDLIMATAVAAERQAAPAPTRNPRNRIRAMNTHVGLLK